MSRRIRKASLRGWWKMLPFILIPASVVFVEAWLQTQILRNNYESSHTLRELRESASIVDSLRDRRHELGRMERIHSGAIDLGLIEPGPGQIEVIRVEDELRSRERSDGETLAYRQTD